MNIARPGALPPLSTHGTELPYLFDQPNAAGWQRTKVLSFMPLQSQVTNGFAAAHHCSFWAAG